MINAITFHLASSWFPMKSTDDDPWAIRRSPKDTQPKRHNDDRSPFERDRARILHSAAFRRLQAKTQVLGINEGDFHRTRLTHSVEVAQIATGLGVRFARVENEDDKKHLPSRELIEAICFGHDLGHPPFGHGGERALNNALLTSPDASVESIGFEGNGQTLRLVTSLEAHTQGYGLDLTRRTLLGLLKYPAPYSVVIRSGRPEPKPLFMVRWSAWKPPKCYLDTETEWVDWILEPLSDADRTEFTRISAPTDEEHGRSIYKSLDCSIMDVADEIAYGVHDFEDGVALRLITRPDWDERVKPHYNAGWAAEMGLPANPDTLALELFADGTGGSSSRKRAVGALVNAMLSSVRLLKRKIFSIPLIDWTADFSGPAKELQQSLQDVIFTKVINTPCVKTLEYRGQINLLALFRAIETDPAGLLGGELCASLDGGDEQHRLRVIADYIAGMTDEYATKMFERMFVPRHGTVFDRL